METERLIIRGFEESDAEKCFQNWGQDRSLGRYLPMFPMGSVSEMESWIHGFVGNHNVWLIEEKSSHEPIGYISVDIPYEILKIGEIGYLLGERWRHKGYALEALEVVVTHLFSERKLYLAEAKYNENNRASGSLLRRLGFRTDGILRGRRIDRETGERCGLVVCSVTNTEFEERAVRGVERSYTGEEQNG